MTQPAKDNFATHTSNVSSPEIANPIAPLTVPKTLVERSETGTHVQLSVPHNGNLSAGVLTSVLGASNRGLKPNIVMPYRSWHCWNFNACWTQALNSNPRPEFFVMHHADVMAERGWFDRLVDIIRDTNADVVSCNVAIKDDSKELSTAVFLQNESGYRVDRVRIDESEQLPQTFTMNTLEEKFPKYKGGKLLLNTGLWICKFRDAKIVDIKLPDETVIRGPWPEYFYFRMTDVIVKNGDRWEPNGMSEDWQASIDWQEMGLDIRATNAVKVHHFGFRGWTTGGTNGT